MKTSKLSHAIRMVLAAQVGASAIAIAPVTVAQQMPVQQVAPQPQIMYVQHQQGPVANAQMVYPQGSYGQMVYPQSAYPAHQAPAVYQQPAPQQQMMYAQQPQPAMNYSRAYQAQPQMMYRQPAPQQQVMYAQPQPMMLQAAPMQPQPIAYSQGAVMYPQNGQYGNVVQQPGTAAYVQAGAIPQGMVMYQQGDVPAQQAPMVVYQNGVPVQYPGGVVYGYAGQVPQGAVMYANGMIMQPAAMNGMMVNGATVLPNSVGATDEVLGDRARLQTGSAGKLNTSPSNVPVQTLTGDELRQVNAVNVESALNTLPQVIAGTDRTTNSLAGGRANVDLRGLGANRTAVLVNGRPFAPSGASGTADLNAIPLALIKQVDVTTGGASVAYGSGALAGAVNFVLDENYQGVELNVSHQGTPEREAGISSADLTLGTDFAQGRGNFAISIGTSERESLQQGDREFSAFAQFDSSDSNGNPILVNGGSTGVAGTSIFSGSLGNYSPSFGVTFDENGQIRPFETGEQNDFYNFAQVNHLQLPQTREHATAVASFELAESAELYALGMYSATETQIQLAPTPIFLSGSQFTLDDSPFLTLNSQQILSDAFGDGIDTDGDGIDDTASAFLRRRMTESGNRTSTLNSVSEYVQGGLRGNIGSSLEYDIYASRSNVNSTDTQQGAISQARFRQSLLLDLDADANGTVCQDPSSGSADVACAPSNIFGPGNLSDRAASFLAVSYATESEYEQSIYGARLTGKIGSLPGGDARFTVGGEHREDSYQQEFVTGNGAPGEVVSGFNNVPSYGGQTSSESLYGDIYLPLAANADGAELVDLELGYRITEHSTASDVASYGAALSLAPTEFFRIRTAYNQAHRAPNIGELYLPEVEGFPGAADPCSASGAPQGGLTPDQVAICIATGVPAELVGSSAINPAGGQVRAIGGGNLELNSEQAETFSAGLEVAFPMGDRASVRLGGDYFTISGTDAIAPFGGGAANVLNNCYVNNNSSSAASAFCDVINRAPDGTIDSIELKSQNEASFEVEGVDLFAGVSLPVMGGTLGLNFNGTLLNTHSFTSFEGADSIECAGRFGLLCGEPLPEYSHRVTAGWTTDNLTAAVIWRHVGEVTDDDDSSTYFVEKIGARDYLDAELSLDFADSIGLSIGVQNLTDVAPPVIGDNQERANTYPATYDVFGRTYFVRLTGSSSLDGK